MSMRQTRTSAIPFLQQQKHQYHAVVRIITGSAGMRSKSTYTVFFFKQDRVRKLVLKEVSEFWRIPTPPDKCISRDFSPEEFVSAL